MIDVTFDVLDADQRERHRDGRYRANAQPGDAPHGWFSKRAVRVCRHVEHTVVATRTFFVNARNDRSESLGDTSQRPVSARMIKKSACPPGFALCHNAQRRPSSATSRTKYRHQCIAGGAGLTRAISIFDVDATI